MSKHVLLRFFCPLRFLISIVTEAGRLRGRYHTTERQVMPSKTVLISFVSKHEQD